MGDAMEYNERFVLALDQGTTSSRAIVFDAQGVARGAAQEEFPQHYPRPGWVEQDADDIWRTQCDVAGAALRNADVSPKQVAAIGVTNQRETAILWDRSTGRPVHNAIVWQCRRTAEMCRKIAEAGHTESIREKTGLEIDAYFSASKVAWMLNEVPTLRTRAEAGELAFGTVDTWLLWNLTGGRVHATDVTNAARTMLFNIHDRRWDPDLLALFGIPPAVLPDVRPSSGSIAETSPDLFDGCTIPIAGVAGDQHAALFGQACFDAGMVKNTYGTGCFILTNTGETPVTSRARLLTTPAWSLDDNQITYASEGSVFVAGAAIQWLRDKLAIVTNAAESEAAARRVDGTHGVYVVPAFAGLGAPYWDPQARGGILGLTSGAGRDHIIRATLESIAFQTRDVIEAVRSDGATDLRTMRVDGGASANDFLMQFQADILGIPVERPAGIETTAAGAAFLAGLAVGFWPNVDALRQLWHREKRFEPAMSADERDTRYAGWRRAVERVRDWATE